MQHKDTCTTLQKRKYAFSFDPAAFNHTTTCDGLCWVSAAHCGLAIAYPHTIGNGTSAHHASVAGTDLMYVYPQRRFLTMWALYHRKYFVSTLLLFCPFSGKPRVSLGI